MGSRGSCSRSCDCPRLGSSRAAHLCDEQGQGRIPLAQLLSRALQHEWDQGPLKSHSLCLTIYELINIEQLLSGVQARVNPSKHSTKGSGRAVGAAGALLCQGWLQSRMTALRAEPCPLSPVWGEPRLGKQRGSLCSASGHQTSSTPGPHQTLPSSSHPCPASLACRLPAWGFLSHFLRAPNVLCIFSAALPAPSFAHPLES